MAKFEQLPNELILLCFKYLDFYTIYEIFLHYNKRFQQLIEYHTRICIDLSLVPSKKFLTFYFQLNELARLKQNYPLSIVAYNKDKIQLILEDALSIETFSKLKSLTLSNINSEMIYNMIFDYPTKLYESLERLNLLVDVENHRSRDNIIEYLCCNLISSKMKSLKYLKLNFRSLPGCKCTASSDYLYLDFNQFTLEDKSFSTLETLIIGDDDDQIYTILYFNVLNKTLLPRLPKLRNLMLACIDFDDDTEEEQILRSTTETNPKISSNLKFVKVGIEENEFMHRSAKVNMELLQKYFLSNKAPNMMTIEIFIQETEKY